MSHLVRSVRWQCVSTLLAILVLFSLPTMAQEASGRVIGVVTDPSGSVIPKAKVTVTNVDTNVSNEATSGPDGSYQVPLLPVGSYSVTAEAQGFRKTVISAQKLEINQSLKVDIKMEVGTTSETVQVEANASGVETVVATLGSVVSGAQIAEAPLNGRNVMDLATLLPGVVPAQDGGSAAHFNIGGGRGDSVTYLLDGGMNNNLLSNDHVANPNPDAVEEFRVLTSNYNAEYGRNGAGIVSVVTKSGSNDFHGALFEYVRNDYFNANKFFNNEQGLPRDVLKRNQFGAEVGGPVWIPKVFNGRNRLFFMSAWESQRLSQLRTASQVNVFTPDELKGDFSHSGPGGGPDQNVVGFLQQYSYFQPNPTLAAKGIIDPTRIDPVSQKYISANLIPSTPTGILFQQGSAQDNFDELTNKVDFVATDKDRVSVTLYAFRENTIGLGNPIGNGGSEYNGGGANRYLGTASYTKTFSPTMVNEFRFTAQRNNGRQAFPTTKLPTPAQLGVGITPDEATGPTRLYFYDENLSNGFSPQGPTKLIDNTYIWNDTFSWLHNNHSFKMGFSYTPYQDNTKYDFYVNGEFDFYGTSGGSSYLGNDRAAFLMGLPDEYFQFGAAPSNIRTHNVAGFFQDEWKVRKNLTLSLGIRYEYSSPKLDLQGRSFSLAFGQQSQRFTGAPLGELFPGDPNAPRGANFPDRNDWAPRFGFAWDPKGDGKMSLRGGFGVFYDILKGEDNLQFNGQAPFFGFVDFNLPSLNGNPTGPVNFFEDPFGVTGLHNPFPSRPPASNINFNDAGFLPVGGGGVFFVNPHLRTPYVYQYNMSVQRELFKNMTLEVSYIGSDSHKLTALVDRNPFILGTKTRIYNTQPGVPSYGFSYLEEFDNAVQANYNSLAVGLQKRYSDTPIGSVQFQFSWTYGHSIDNSSGFRTTGSSSSVPAYDWDHFRASSDYDLRHYIAFSGVWELPFAKMWANGPHRLTSGWTLYPIVTFRTGAPFTVFAGLATTRTRPGPSGAGDAGNVLANQVAQVTYFDPKNYQTLNNPDYGDNTTGNFWFNPSAFSGDFSGLAPGQFSYGTSSRNAYRGPDVANFNLTLAKTIALAERLKFEIRADFFNILNHAEFNLPSTSIGSSTFGQISNTADPRIIQLAGRFTF
ncbi:MAG TPA: TonB-dependent receptor [Bryobacteraceae bacterium]|nr:TonB-dependent receptor [Bryobacteraceae bacterium]